MNRKLLVLSAVLAIGGLAAADAVLARGGGSGGGRNRSAASRKARQQAKKDGKKKDLEAAREKLRQMDYRDRDSSRDRGPL